MIVTVVLVRIMLTPELLALSSRATLIRTAWRLGPPAMSRG